MCLAKHVDLTVDNEKSWVKVKVNNGSLMAFTCVLSQFDSHIKLDEDSQLISWARFSFEFKNLKTGDSSRDQRMLEWIDIKRHPSGCYLFRAIEHKGKDTFAKGTFSMHGVENEIRIKLNYRTTEDNRFIITGEHVMDYRDYDLPIIYLLFFQVDPILKVKIHLEGSLPTKD